jgi:hypothetical protein
LIKHEIFFRCITGTGWRTLLPSCVQVIPDEVVHLSTTMLVASFNGVVGMMW